MPQSVIRRFLELNRRLSIRSTQPLERRGWRRAALLDFTGIVVPGLLKPGMKVLDAGSGKYPNIAADVRRRLDLHVTGLDLDERELQLAPPGAYDDAIIGDVTTARVPEKYDLVISRTLLEHVPDVAAAIRNLATALRPGGTMVHVLPNRRAPFAMANRLLGHRWGRRVLFALNPKSRAYGGFPAYYNRCTPGALAQCCRDAGLEVTSTLPYYTSHYCAFFFPLFLLEAARQAAFEAVGTVAFCELFALTARKPAATLATSGDRRRAAA